MILLCCINAHVGLIVCMRGCAQRYRPPPALMVVPSLWHCYFGAHGLKSLRQCPKLCVIRSSVRSALCCSVRGRESSTGRTSMKREVTVITRKPVNQRNKTLFSDSFTAAKSSTNKPLHPRTAVCFDGLCVAHRLLYVQVYEF